MRHLYATDRINEYLDWPGVGQVCRIDRTRSEHGHTSQETVYAITSLTPERADAKMLQRIWRGHWGIENRLHYIRDVTLGEDACRVTSGHAPQALAAIRNLVVHLLTQENPSNRAAAMRKFSLHPKSAATTLGVIGVL